MFLKLVREWVTQVKNVRSKTLPLRDLRARFHGALDELGAFLPDFKNRRISFVCAGDMALLWAQGESSNPFSLESNLNH